MDVESIAGVGEDLIAAGIVVAGVDDTEGVRVSLLGCEDGGEEDTFSASAGVAEGMEEGDDAGVG